MKMKNWFLTEEDCSIIKMALESTIQNAQREKLHWKKELCEEEDQMEVDTLLDTLDAIDKQIADMIRVVKKFDNE